MAITKQSFRTGPNADFFAQGVQVGNILYLAGQVGVDDAGAVGSDITEQWRLAYGNVQAVLAEFDATIDNVVDETIFVTDVGEVAENMEGLAGIRSDAFGGAPEVAATMVQVSSLWDPSWKIEIKCIAHL